MSGRVLSAGAPVPVDLEQPPSQHVDVFTSLEAP